MAEQIGIRLNLQGATQVQSGLQGVVRSLGDLDSKTLKVGDAFRALAPTVAAALSVGTVATWIKSAIDAGDAAGKLAETIGVATNQVAGLQLAFRQSGVSADQLAPIMSKLAAAISNGNKALDAMQIATRNADGSLRGTRDVLADVAQRFAGYENGASKTALAVALLGEEGAKLIPLLNGGASGLDAMDAKARAFGLTVNDETSRALAKFNDDLNLLNERLKGVAQTIAGPLVNALNTLFERLQRSNLKVFATEMESELRALRANMAVRVAEDLEEAARRNPLNASMRAEADRARAQAQQRLREAVEANEALKRLVSEKPSDQPNAANGAMGQAPAVGGSTPSGRLDPAVAAARQLLERLDQQNYVLNKQIELGRELTQGEKLRIQLVDDIGARRVSMNAETEKAVVQAMREGDALRATWQAQQDRKKQKDADDVAAKKADQDRRAAQAQRLNDLRAELRQQGLNTQALDDQILGFMRGQEAVEAERDARELRRATMLEERAAAMEVFGIQAEEVILLRRMAASIIEQVEARKRLRSEQQYQSNKSAIDAARQSADEIVASIKDETAALRMSSQEREISNALLQLEAIGLEKGSAAYEDYAKRIREAVIGRNAVAESIRQQERLAQEWERMTDQVGNALANALINGGQSAGESIKRYFSTLILQPIIRAVVDPMARTIMSMLGFASASGSAAAGTSGAANAAGGLTGMAGSIGSLSGIFSSGSAAGIAGNIMGGLGSAGAMISGGSTLQGMAMGAGTIGGALAPIAIGQMIGRSISGGYSAIGGSSGSSAVNMGTAVGAVFGGPIGAAIGAAIGGLVNRAFGRRLEDTGIQGTFGGEQSFTGSQFEFLRGGWFRSDKTRTSALASELQSVLGDGFGQLRDETLKMARDLGLASESVSAFTKDIKISFKGLTDEQIAQRLQQELGSVADEMARLVAGGDATAASLRQLYISVITQRDQLETQLLQLLGDTEELRRRERAAIHESNLALYDRIVALKDEQAALAAAAGAAQDALARQISASQSAANAARQAADAYAQAGTSLRQTIAALLGTNPSATAGAAYRSALAAAQGGDAAAMGDLGSLASSYAETLRARAGSASEARIASARIAAELQGVATLSDTLGAQRSVQAALLDINTAALQVLQDDLENGDFTVETLQQHTTLLQAISSALGSTGAIATAVQTLDTNVDGLLTFDELQRGLAGKASDAQINALIARADTNADRQISVQELAADQVRQRLEWINGNTWDVSQKILSLTTNIIDSFASLDRNVDGLLTFDELRQGLAGKATDAQISALIARADRNADAQVSLQELTAERVRSVVLGTGDIVNAANRTTATTGSVATATGGVIDEQSRAVSYLANSDVTLARVLAKLSETDPTNLLLVDRVTSGNTLVADRLSQVIAAINAQTAAQQAETKRQQDLQRAQADLKSAAGYMGSLQSQLANAQATLQDTPATVSVRVGTRYDLFGFSKGGIYEDRPNPAYQSAIDSLNAAQAALNQYTPTVEALRQQIRQLGGVPQFAQGGMHTGGLRIVGERGPELEATGPARYWSAADTTAMLGNSQRREELLAAEIRALRTEVQGLRAEARVTAVAANKSQRLWERVTRDGESMQITDVTPSP